MARASLRRGLCFLNVYFGAKKVYVLRDLYFSFTFFQTKLRPISELAALNLKRHRQASRQLTVLVTSTGGQLTLARSRSQNAPCQKPIGNGHTTQSLLICLALSVSSLHCTRALGSRGLGGARQPARTLQLRPRPRETPAVSCYSSPHSGCASPALRWATHTHQIMSRIPDTRVLSGRPGPNAPHTRKNYSHTQPEEHPE